ncbi:DUF4303 domain-containing protein [Acidovorax sp.]|uniref:DUF4303 domain-containing protein n=1 Tax=Acidovorax sp. TaxID=1872122 RepID=UPI00391B9EFE
MQPTQSELAEAIATATRSAVLDLFREHRETFYYVTLITTGEAHPPFLVAWSQEALASEAEKGEPGDECYLKWSYAESPYMCYGDQHFVEVNRLFGLRPRMTSGMTSAEWDAEFDSRLDAMEVAMKQLDDEGVFGRGDTRASLFINVEVMPPDITNTERALRLNREDSPVLAIWLEEMAEK